jgi:hypothetical protein
LNPYRSVTPRVPGSPLVRDDVEPPQLLDRECSVEEFVEICRWKRERVRKHLDIWKNDLAQLSEVKKQIKG